MPGPLPQETRRRRNAPTIPTTNLPAGGCDLEPPAVPDWVRLGERGRAWWDWAWSTPQAAAWSPEAHAPTVAQRALLEDDLFSAEHNEDPIRARAAVIAKITTLEDRLGLSPKSMAQLRWKIVEDDKKPAAEPKGDNVIVSDRWKRTGS